MGDTIESRTAAATDNRNEILQELRQVRDLPTLPTVFVGIMRTLRNPHASFKDIARVVESDQTMTMKILRLINSSFYGLSRRVDSVQQAVALLGANTLKNVVISASVFKALGGGSQDKTYNREAFWQHSVGCGMIARYLGNKVGYGREEEGFISGLIHDIGKVVLDQYFHDKLVAVLDQVRRTQVSFYQAEIETLGTTHSEIGAILAETWSLPPNLVEVIARHHDFRPDSKFARLVALAQVSNMLAHKNHAGWGGDDLVPEVDPLVWQATGLDADRLDEWDESIKAEFRNGAELLDLMLK